MLLPLLYADRVEDSERSACDPDDPDDVLLPSLTLLALPDVQFESASPLSSSYIE